MADEASNIKASLAVLLREKRKSLRLSQKEAAIRIGCAQSNIARLERASNLASIDLLVRALLALGLGRSDIARAVEGQETGTQMTMTGTDYVKILQDDNGLLSKFNLEWAQPGQVSMFAPWLVPASGAMWRVRHRLSDNRPNANVDWLLLQPVAGHLDKAAWLNAFKMSKDDLLLRIQTKFPDAVATPDQEIKVPFEGMSTLYWLLELL